MNIIHIDAYPIRLDQFLKLAGVVGSGCEAKVLIQNGCIQVNGSIEKRRGRKLYQKYRVDLEDGASFVLA